MKRYDYLSAGNRTVFNLTSRDGAPFTFYTAGALSALIAADPRLNLDFKEATNGQKRFYKIAKGKKKRISREEAATRYLVSKARLFQGDFTSLDLLSAKELKDLVRENPELGYKAMKTVSGQTRFYRTDEDGKKEVISADSLREEAYLAYLTLRMKEVDQVNELARKKEIPDEEIVEDKGKLLEVYRALGITQGRNGEGITYLQDKKDDFSNGNRRNPKQVSEDYVLEAVAAYAEYEKLIESDDFDDLDWANQLAEVFFPRDLVHQAQRRLFLVYGDEGDAGQLYRIEAGIDDITNPIHASSDTEWELEVERMTMPLSAAEAADFEREEVRMVGLERWLVRASERA